MVTARLHRELVTAGATAPARWLLMTHGIYGSGGNWRSIARKIIERRPAWGAVLVDLRGHGRSEAGVAPHTIAACARDLAECIAGVVGERGGAVAAIAGHSFGGKVVLALRAGGGAAAAALAQTWVLDSTPSVRPGMWERADNDVRDVWEAMRAMPARFARRDDFVAAIQARGHAATLAHWLAMNLAPLPDGGFRLTLELDAIKAMLDDYYAIDLWPALEDPALPGDAHVVIGGRSDTVSPADRARLAAEPPDRRITAHTIEGAGHWLHIDAPVAVVDLIAAALPR